MSATSEAMKTQGLLIGGQKIGTDRIDEVLSPYDGALVGTVCLGGPYELEKAIVSGLEGAKASRALPRHERRRVLREIAAGIRADRDALARTIALEAGKPLAQARGEVDRAVVTFDLAADATAREGGEVVPIDLEPRAEG